MKIKIHTFLTGAICFVSLPVVVSAQILFSEDFDTDHTANWTVNSNFGPGTNAANFTFDYSTVGIVSAPHSTGGSTIGLKLGANLLGIATPALAGISVSPTGQSFTGIYTVEFDWWQNWLGSTTTGIGSSSGGSGSTQLSTFGVKTSGTTPNLAGQADGVFFAATGDGASSADYRAYAPMKPTGFVVTDSPTNTYAAGGQNNTASYYTTLFPGGNTAPTIQTNISSTQTGSTLAGTAGFAWHDVILSVSNNIITWTIDGTLIATVNTNYFTAGTGGNNILFGMSDTSTGAGTPANLFEQLDFTLIDNIVVKAVPEPAVIALGFVGAAGWYLSRRRRK